MEPTRLLCPWDVPSKNTGVGLPCPPPGDLPDPGTEPASLMSPALAGGFFTTSTIWEAQTFPSTPSNAHLRVGGGAGGSMD